jgi:hypothetical protein
MRPHEQWSSPAIITYPQDIQIASRERGLRQLEQALSGLENTSAASLQTLEIFDLLQRLDQADQGEEGSAFVPRTPRDTKDGSGTYHVLTYEQFLESRRAAGEEPGQSLHNTLAGTSHFSVRNVLNRLLGRSAAELEVEDEDAGVHDIDQNDEAPDPPADKDGKPIPGLVAGIGERTESTPSLSEVELAKGRNRLAECDRLLNAVSLFQKRLKEKQEARRIDTIEMLRVRLMLMVICQAAHSADAKSLKKLPMDKVLAAEDSGNGWTDIIGRLIFALINGANSPLRQLYFQNLNGQVPIDLLECWATCYWCAQACLAAPVSTPQQQRLTKYLRPHLATLYQLTLPSQAELLSDTVIDIMDRMSAVYGPAMGVESLSEVHRVAAKQAIP